MSRGQGELSPCRSRVWLVYSPGAYGETGRRAGCGKTMPNPPIRDVRSWDESKPVLQRLNLHLAELDRALAVWTAIRPLGKRLSSAPSTVLTPLSVTVNFESFATIS